MKIIAMRLNPDIIRDPNGFFSFLTSLPVQERDLKVISLYIESFKQNNQKLMKDLSDFYSANIEQQEKMFQEAMKVFSEECKKIIYDFEKTETKKPALSTMSMGQLVEFLSNLFKDAGPQVITHESGATSTITTTIDAHSIIANQQENSFAVDVHVVFTLQDSELV